MAGELGRGKVRAQRGWEALKAIGWSIQSSLPGTRRQPVPRRKRLLKKLADTVAEEAAKHPDKPIEV
jgi:hypothetical protein